MSVKTKAKTTAKQTEPKAKPKRRRNSKKRICQLEGDAFQNLLLAARLLQQAENWDAFQLVVRAAVMLKPMHPQVADEMEFSDVLSRVMKVLSKLADDVPATPAGMPDYKLDPKKLHDLYELAVERWKKPATYPG